MEMRPWEMLLCEMLCEMLCGKAALGRLCRQRCAGKDAPAKVALGKCVRKAKALRQRNALRKDALRKDAPFGIDAPGTMLGCAISRTTRCPVTPCIAGRRPNHKPAQGKAKNERRPG